MYGQSKLRQRNVVQSCKLFRSLAQQAFTRMRLSVLAFFNVDGTFILHKKLNRQHGYSSPIIDAFLQLFAKKQVALTYDVGRPRKTPIGDNSPWKDDRTFFDRFGDGFEIQKQSNIVYHTGKANRIDRSHDATQTISMRRQVWEGMLYHSELELTDALLDEMITSVYNNLHILRAEADSKQSFANEIAMNKRNEMWKFKTLRTGTTIALQLGIMASFAFAPGMVPFAAVVGGFVKNGALKELAKIGAKAVPGALSDTQSMLRSADRHAVEIGELRNEYQAADNLMLGKAVFNAIPEHVDVGMNAFEEDQIQEVESRAENVEGETREQLRWIDNMIEWADRWIQPTVESLVEDANHPKMVLRDSIKHDKALEGVDLFEFKARFFSNLCAICRC